MRGAAMPRVPCKKKPLTCVVRGFFVLNRQSCLCAVVLSCETRVRGRQQQ